MVYPNYQATMTELYNWYVDTFDKVPHICGDIVQTPLIQSEFDAIMMNNKLDRTVKSAKILRADTEYRKTHTIVSTNSIDGSKMYDRPPNRMMVFVREPIKSVPENLVIVTAKHKFILRNVDSFFEKLASFQVKCEKFKII